MNTNTPLTTRATVKSPFLSKTNITATLLAIFGMLVAFDLAPAALATQEFVGTIVTGGAALVIAFRTFTDAVLRR